MGSENRLALARGWGWGVGNMGERGQKIQTSSYNKINKSWGCVVNNTRLYGWKLLRD